MQIIPGIYQIKVPMGIPDNPLGFTNTYLIEGETGWTLIDTGWNAPGSFESFEQDLKEIGLGFTDIELIIITHAHPDHYGLAPRFKEASGAQIAIGQEELPAMERRFGTIELFVEKMDHWLYRNGVPATAPSEVKSASKTLAKMMVPIEPDRILAHGEIISTGKFSLEVMHTPGHSDGHICLYEHASKILLAGDHILPLVTPNISLHAFSKGDPLGDYIKSLAAISQMEVKLVLPAHEHIFENLQERIEALRVHHDDRMAAILATIGKEAKTAYHISSEIPWGLDMGGIDWNDMTDLDRRMAVTEALAHLEALSMEGKVSRCSREDIILYKSI